VHNPPTVVQDIANSLEILTNLVYLTKLAADEPEKVITYMLEADKTIQRFALALKGGPFTSISNRAN